MQQELINAASELFPTFEHWQSFLELYGLTNDIAVSWFAGATERISRHFMETLPPEWDCEAWGDTSRDTRWFLRQFGPVSLTVSYAWAYRLDLRLHDHEKFSAELVTRLLKESEYRPIHLAFDRIDRRFEWGSELIELGNFKFGTAQDGHFSERDLAWHAAHQMDAFVSQAIAKIERFTNNPQVTELIRRLNQTASDESQAKRNASSGVSCEAT